MKRYIHILAIAVFTLFLASCSKLNMENYDRLKMGMEQKEVENIIGSPTNCEDSVGSRSCIWGSEDGKFVKINFVGGKAVLFNHDGLE